MILIIDVGNTLTKFGFSKDCKRYDTIDIIPTKELSLLNLKKLFKNNIKIKKSYIGSVVPSINNKLNKWIKLITKVDSILITDKNFEKYFNLSKFKDEVGVDILGFSYFLSKKYIKALGICFGTAMFAVGVDKKKLYGAIITPYIEKGIRELLARTEMMRLQKKESFQKPFYDFGINTVQALTSGVNHFYMGFTNNICEYFNEKYGFNKLCITGGNQNKIQYSPFIIKNFNAEKIDNAVLKGYLLLINDME